MDFLLSLISSFSIGIAVVIGLVRFRNLSKAYQPFLIICIVALLNEGLSIWMVRQFNTNAVNANIYVWIECMLFLRLFHSWGFFRNRRWHLPALVIILTTIWIFDNLVWNRISQFNSLFRICYSFCLIFLSIEQINVLLVSIGFPLIRQPKFLICTGIIIFYSYKAIMEVFYLLKLQLNEQFYDNVFLILSLVNLFVNLVYALALLWVPKKQTYM